MVYFWPRLAGDRGLVRWIYAPCPWTGGRAGAPSRLLDDLNQGGTMDLDFTEEQEMLRRSVKDFMEKECTSKFVREMETDERGYAPDMWRQFAELGWLAIHLPEEYGGIGGRYLDLVPVYEEMGRALCPTPHLQTCVMAAAAIRAAGSEEQKTEWLTRVANGEVIIAFALTEPSATIEASGVKTTAAR